MDAEAFYLSRLDPPRFFRATDLPEGAACCECERPIKEGEVISEDRNLFIHMECVTP